MGEMTCFQAMHVSLIMQHLGAGDINGSHDCLVSLGSYLFLGKVSPTQLTVYGWPGLMFMFQSK